MGRVSILQIVHFETRFANKTRFCWLRPLTATRTFTVYERASCSPSKMPRLDN